MKFLLLDTTISGVACAVVDGSSPVLSPDEVLIAPEVGGSAQKLPELVAKSFERSGVLTDRKKDVPLVGVVVGQGPGSFTGTRVGLAFTAGLLAANPKLNILGLDALACAADWMGKHASIKSENLTLILPSTRTQAFAADVETNPRSDGASVASRIFDLSDSKQWGLLAPPRQVVVCGEDASLQSKAASHGIRLETATVSDVSLAAICGMNQRFRDLWPRAFNQRLPDAVYMRGSTVEEKLHGRQI